MDNSIDFDTTQDAELRKLRKNARRTGDAQVVGYIAPDGTKLALTGDDEAPYVKIINTADAPVQVTIAGSSGGGSLSVAGTMQGTIAHDAPDVQASNFPLKVGGFSDDEAPVLVSLIGDIVNAYFDRAGRQQVNQELAIAGENLALNVLRVVSGKLAVEQESWDLYNSALGTAATTHSIKTSAGRVCRVQVMNAHNAEVVCFVFNNTAASGTVVARFAVPASTGGVFGTAEWSAADEDGVYCDTGIYVAVSTSASSVVAPAAGVYAHVTYA